MFWSYFREIWHPQIKMIYTSSLSKYWGGSESEHRNLNSISGIHIWHISVEWIFGHSRMNYAITRDPTAKIRHQTQNIYLCIHSSKIRTFYVKYFIINCTDETATVCIPVILLSMAIWDAIGGILSFWLQIQNLYENPVQMIYRSSRLVEVQFPPKYG